MNETKQVQLPAIVQEELKSVEQVRQKILDMVPLVYFAEELIAKFKDIPGTSKWWVSCGYGLGRIQGVNIHVNCLDFRELVVVRRWLREQGFPIPKIEDYGEISRRTWTYVRQQEPNLILSGFAGDVCNTKPLEGQKCEFVKVGMKEPEPIYELRCDGEKLTEENGAE